MPGHERQPGVRQLTVDHVQIGAAHGAGAHAEQHLARPRPRSGPILQHKRALRGSQDEGAHGSAPSILRPAPPVLHASPRDRLPGEEGVAVHAGTAVQAGISHPFSRMVSSMSSLAASFR
jgi:hypothetical protein